MHKSSITRLTAVAVAGISIIALAGCSSSDSSSKSDKPSVYTIGAALPLSGSAAALGQYFENGIQTAVNQLNAKGGIGGVKVAVNYKDNQLLAGPSVTAMNQLLALGGTQAVIMTSSAGVTAAAPIATKNKALMLNPGGEDPTLQKLSPYLISNIPNVKTEIDAMLPYLKTQGYKRMAMYAEGDALGATASSAVETEWKKLGGTFLGSEQEPITVVDHSSVISKIKSENPDIIYVLAGGQQAGTFIKQARQLGLDTQLVGASPLQAGGVQPIAGKALDGMLDSGIAQPLKSSNPAAVSYKSAFTKAFPKADPTNVYTIFGHDAVLIWANAALYLQKHKMAYNGDNLLKAIHAVKNFQGAGGTTQIASDGSSIGAITFLKVADGKFVPFQTVPASQVAKDQAGN